MEQNKLIDKKNNNKVCEEPKLEGKICDFIEQTRDNIGNPLGKIDLKETQKEKISILIIDDEIQILDYLKMALELNNYDVIVASNGNDGLNLYKKNLNNVNLVILDLTMPDIKGQTVFEEMLKIRDNVNVIISSGQCFEEIREGTLSNASGFLSKPFKLFELYETVKIALNKKGL